MPQDRADTTNARSARQFWFVAGASIAIHVGFTIWALASSFFFVDDYRLLLDSRDATGLSWEYVLAPFDSQFMPGGRLIVWLVDEAGTTSWWAAATSIVLLRATAAAGCLWMLVTVFGRRREVLLLLALYLFSAITVPATMWWAASLNQIPLQIALFVGIGAGIRYLRNPSWRSLGVMLTVLALGLVFYVKAVLLAPVLAWIALTTFTQGTWRRRLVDARRYWHALLFGSALLAAFSIKYLLSVPQAFEGTGSADTATEVADAMLLRALPTGLLGGPWRWLETSLPLAIAGPPSSAVTLAWIVVLAVAAYLGLRYRGAWHGLLLIPTYAFALYLLLLTTRGQLYGGFAALDYRYLTDIACIMPLALGLACLPVHGAPNSARPREEPLLTWRAPSWTPIFLAAVVAAGGTFSAVTYVEYWHDYNAGKAWVARLQLALEELGTPVDLADQPVPGSVMPSYTRPANRTSRLLPLIAPQARFPRTSEDLYAIDTDGRVAKALIEPVALSTEPESEACARILLPGETTTLALDGPSGAEPQWLRLGYLAPQETRVTISMGGTTYEPVLRQGLHQLFAQTAGDFDKVTVTSDDEGGRVCLDQLEVGQPQPAPELP